MGNGYTQPGLHYETAGFSAFTWSQRQDSHERLAVSSPRLFSGPKGAVERKDIDKVPPCTVQSPGLLAKARTAMDERRRRWRPKGNLQ